MDIPLDVEVHCADGPCGRSTAIIVERASRQVTHFAVESDGNEYLVPIDAIAESSAVRIDLRWSREDLTRADLFVKEVAASDEQIAIMTAAMTQSNVMGPYSAPDAVYMANYMTNATVPEEQVADTEVAIHRDARVETSDGSSGWVEELIIDPQTNKISHLVLRKGHLWGQRDIFVPLDQVDHVADGVVYLKIDKAALGRLPAIHKPKK